MGHSLKVRSKKFTPYPLQLVGRSPNTMDVNLDLRFVQTIWVSDTRIGVPEWFGDRIRNSNTDQN